MPLPLILAGITAATGIYSSIHAAQERKKQEAEMKAQMANRPNYQTPQSLTDYANDAKSRVNAMNPALLAVQQQAQQQAAATAGYAQRNASSGAQALAAASDAQANYQQLLPQLANQQTAFQQNNLDNYAKAQGALTEDARYKQQDRLGQYSDLMNYYLGRIGASSANMSQGLGLAANGLMGLASSGANFGGGGANGQYMANGGYGYNSIGSNGYYNPYLYK